MADFNLVSCDRLLSLLEDNLSGYAANGLLDTGKFYKEIAYFTSQLGLASYEFKDSVVTLCDHKGELPCDFFILDSAWLCHHNWNDLTPHNFPWRNFQDQIVIYSEKECETVAQYTGGCNQPNMDGVVVNSTCLNERVLNKVTIREYVKGLDFNSQEWGHCFNFHPQLLTLGDKVTQKLCSKGCPNLFHTSENAITIRKQGSSYYIYSHMKHPVIYIKYYAEPIDPETKLPLIPDHPVMTRAYQSHLTAFFFETIWTDNSDVDIEKKVKYWNEKAAIDKADALYLSKLPSFNKMVETTRRNRKRLQSYEIMNVIHPF